MTFLQVLMRVLVRTSHYRIGENDTREENWEGFRCNLFEEVVMYSTIPADSVSKNVLQ